jgi:hypothetical protein
MPPRSVCSRSDRGSYILVVHRIGDQKLIISRSSVLRKPLVLAAFAIIGTHQFTLGSRGGLWLILFMCDP